MKIPKPVAFSSPRLTSMVSMGTPKLLGWRIAIVLGVTATLQTATALAQGYRIPEGYRLVQNKSYTDKQTKYTELHYQQGGQDNAPVRHSTNSIRIRIDNPRRHRYVSHFIKNGRVYLVLQQKVIHDANGQFEEVDLNDPRPEATYRQFTKEYARLPTPKLPRPGDLEFKDNKLTYMKEVYKLWKLQRVGDRMAAHVALKQRTADNGTTYQVFLDDDSPDAVMVNKTFYFPMQTTRTKLPRPGDLEFKDNKLTYMKEVYKLWKLQMVGDRMAAHVALKQRTAENGTTYQVFLDDDSPDAVMVNKTFYFPMQTTRTNLPRPDDLKIIGEGSYSYNPYVYTVLKQRLGSKGKIHLTVRIKQRFGPDGRPYQVYVTDNSPDAQFSTVEMTLQGPYNPPDLPRESDLTVQNGGITYNPNVYEIIDWDINRRRLITLKLKIKVVRGPDGTERQVFLDDDDPEAIEKIVQKQIQLPYTPPRLPRPTDLQVRPDGSLVYNGGVYQLLEWTFDPTRHAYIVKIKKRMRRAPDGTEYQVYLDDIQPGDVEKVVQLRLPVRPEIEASPSPPKVLNDTIIDITFVPQPEEPSVEQVPESPPGVVATTAPPIPRPPPVTQIIPHATEPSRQYGTAPSRQYGTAPPPQYGTAPPRQYGTEPPPQYGTAPPRQYGTAPPPQIGTAPPLKYATAPPPQKGNGIKPPATTVPSFANIQPVVTIHVDYSRYRVLNYTMGPDGNYIVTMQVKTVKSPNGTISEVPWYSKHPNATVQTFTKEVKPKIVDVPSKPVNAVHVEPDGRVNIDPTKQKPTGMQLKPSGYVITVNSKKGPETDDDVEYEDIHNTTILEEHVPVEKGPIPPHTLQPGEQLVDSVPLGNGSETILYVVRYYTDDDGKVVRIPVESNRPDSQIAYYLGVYTNSSAVPQICSTPPYVRIPLLNVPSYNLVNSSRKSDDSSVVFAEIQFYSPIPDGPKYVVPYSPKLKGGEMMGGKIEIDSDGNARLVKVWPLGSTSNPEGGANENPEKGIDIMNQIWWQQDPTIKAGQEVVVNVLTDKNPDGTKVVVPIGPKPTDDSSPENIKVQIVPGPDGVSTVVLPPDFENESSGDGTSSVSPRPDIYNIPSWKVLKAQRPDEGTILLDVLIQVHQPIARGPWYVVRMKSKLPNTEKLLAKLMWRGDVIKMIDIKCRAEGKATHSICKGSSSGRTPEIDLPILKKPWIHIVKPVPHPYNKPKFKQYVVQLHYATHPNGNILVVPLNETSPWTTWVPGYLSERDEGVWTFSQESARLIPEDGPNGVGPDDVATLPPMHYHYIDELRPGKYPGQKTPTSKPGRKSTTGLDYQYVDQTTPRNQRVKSSTQGDLYYQYADQTTPKNQWVKPSTQGDLYYQYADQTTPKNQWVKPSTHGSLYYEYDDQTTGKNQRVKSTTPSNLYFEYDDQTTKKNKRKNPGNQQAPLDPLMFAY